MSSEYPAGLFPQPTVDDEAFWNATADHRLIVQACADCGELRHPPTPICPECLSFEVDWVEVPGTGELFTYTITHYTAGEGYEDYVPYTIGVVMLDGTDDIRFITHLVDVEPEDVEIGMPLEVTFEEVEDVTLPLFRPAA